ncbi:uncharacterized protein LOC113768994 [Coffea eugenioides]|uniref:uncharacterized protein LOC113768994 n=1 Tax=Coffea eugenioides TaxID=49369 RepID=UPI000F60900E|nr:uncharacterized protein LOC113768994 [Coffea eugenioides]
MESNKDEAIKAKEMAEQKLAENDILGAKRFASKAQSLFPRLEGLSQILQTLNIYAAAERKVNGELDWYKILGVHPLADAETIKKQYRKLALALHPDKNKAVGADGAFKILSEAWSLLSDKVKRAAYDEKQNIRALYQKGAGQNPPGGVKEYGNENFTNTSSTVSKPSVPVNTQTDSAPPTATFWTQCTRCLIKYQYLAEHRNCILVCYKCLQPFMAAEMPSLPVNNNPTSTPRSQYPQEQGSHPGNNASSDSGRNFPPIPKTEPLGFPGVGLNNKANVPQGSSFKFGGSGSMSTPATAAAQPATVPQGSSFVFGGSRNMSTPATAAAQPAKVPQDSSFKFGGSRSMSTPATTAAAQPATVSEGSSFVFGGSRSMSTPATAAAQPAKVPQDSSFKFGGSRSMSTLATTAAAQPTFTFQRMGENLKRGREEAATGKVHKEFLKRDPSKKSDSGSPSYNVSSSGKVDKTAKKRRVDQHKARVAGKDVKTRARGVSGRGNSRGNQMAKSGAEKVDNLPKSLRELSQSEIREMLMVKARTEIRKKLQQWNVAAVQKSSDATASMSTPKPDALGSLPSASITGSNTEAAAIVTMDVPDPEFYDFDKDRVEKSFTKNQVWASYDNEDGMPRFYAFIHKVLSREPFEVQISWLHSKSSSEFGPKKWVGRGFAKTCGVFRIGKYGVNKALNSFSHRVSWNKGAKGVIQIVPKKGDVWALYRNWSSDWDELTPNDVIRQYDMVEVLQDYNEEQGVAVAPLVKTAGFRSVFHRHLDKNKIYKIPREEMFRFSHQVASYLLTGQEAQAAPKDCRELDTAAMPLELLQVLKEAKEGEVGKIADEVTATGNVDATPSTEDVKHVEPQPILVYSRRSRGSR